VVPQPEQVPGLPVHEEPLPPSNGRDRPVITPALPAPPSGALEGPPPQLAPAEEDPAEAAVSEKLLPSPDQPSGQTLELVDCLRLAFQRHPTLQREIQAVVEAEADIRVVDASYIPTLYISADGTRQADPDISQDNTYQVGLTHTLFDAGQRGRRLKAAQASFRASVRDFQSTWINQTQAVTTAYINVLQAEYQEAIQADNLARTDLNYQVAAAFYKGGLKSMIDVSTARVQQAQAQVSLATAQNTVRVTRIALAQSMGVPLAEVEKRPLNIQPILSSTQLPDRQAALEYLSANNPVLTSLTAQAESNFATAQAERRGNAPVVTANTFYGNTGVYFPQTPVWQFQLQVNFPFFSPSVGPSGDAADAAGQELLQERANQQLLLIQQLDTAISDIEGARERARYAVQGVREALYNADIAYRRYKVGLSDITELINARGNVESTRSSLVSALADLKTAEASFLQAMGQVPVPPGLPADTPLLKEQIEEFPARDEAREHALPSPEPPVNRR
jgi:cobalt-zinc-cadmium efflux system outer membrane protein